ncbi:MAG: type II secretion system protein [Pseudomonadota bacterium]
MISERGGRAAAGQSQKGFTLLEVLAAVLILGLAYVATLESFSVALKNIGRVEKIRANVFDEMVSFSLDTRYTGSESAVYEEQEENSTLFIEGHKFRLLEVRSTSGELASLKLRPLL